MSGSCRGGTNGAILALVLVCTFASPGQRTYGAEPDPTIAAAASLRDLLPELAARFTDRTGIRPRLTFGASGNLRRQIAQGAPFDLFLSADEDYVLDLGREGHLEDDGAAYALGRLALLVPKGSPLEADGSLEDLATALRDGRVRRLAIANPEHAPYGVAAREVLQTLNLWEDAKPRLVIGENVAQAAQFAASGSAQAGIVAYSLAKSPRLAGCCLHAPIPAPLHGPIRHRGALVRGADGRARRFFDFLLAPEGRALIRRQGFDTPDTGG
jgi:molybdate transport system substrate-binding protein